MGKYLQGIKEILEFFLFLCENILAVKNNANYRKVFAKIIGTSLFSYENILTMKNANYGRIIYNKVSKVPFFFSVLKYFNNEKKCRL